MVSVPWWFLEITGAKHDGLTDWMKNRLGQVEDVLSEREWLAAGRYDGTVSVYDLSDHKQVLGPLVAFEVHQAEVPSQGQAAQQVSGQR